MNRLLHHAAFAVGLVAIGWVGFGYVGNNALALGVTLLIAAFYLMGALELQRFHRAGAGLSAALAALPERVDALGPWLATLPPTLRDAVRLRVEGERVGLPGPALVPYLTGLLVLLGMLGTFLGMVVTLDGTGRALETAKDLQGIRASLSGPVRGLGLAFGTSIAGVAASAMLGLMSSLSRRDGLMATQALDSRIATVLRPFSPIHRREETFRLLQRQAELMPALVDRLHALAGVVERQGELLNERLVDGQERFHGKAEAVYAGLADSVDRSLKASLVESARLAGAVIQPIVESAMAGVAREAAALHEKVAVDAAALQRDVARDAAELHRGVAGQAAEIQRNVALHTTSLARDMAKEATTLAEGVAREATALAEGMAREATALAEGMAREATALQGRVGADLERRLDGLAARFEAMTATTAQMWEGALGRHQAAGEALAGRQQVAGEALAADLRLTVDRIASTFERHSAALLDEVGRSAANTIGELRQRLADSLAGDHAMLEERRRVMEALGSLMESATRASVDQRAAIEAMVGSTTDLLDRAGRRFADEAGHAGETLATAAAEITGSVVEVASLGEAFGASVQRFGDANEKLMAQLQGIERALGKSLARSDDQLAYYVAQAREVIDLSLMSQKQIVEDLQQIAGRQVAASAA